MNRIEHNKLMGYIEEVRIRKKGESEATRFIDQLILCVGMLCEYEPEELDSLRDMVSNKKKYQNKKLRLCENIDKAKEIIEEARKGGILPSRVYEYRFGKKVERKYDTLSNSQVFAYANYILGKYRWVTIDGKIALGEKPKFRTIQNLLFYEWKKEELGKVLDEIEVLKKRDLSLSEQILELKEWCIGAEKFGAKKADLNRAHKKIYRIEKKIQADEEKTEELKRRKNEINVWIDAVLTNYYLILPETVTKQQSFERFCKSKTKHSQIQKVKRTFRRVK